MIATNDIGSVAMGRSDDEQLHNWKRRVDARLIELGPLLAPNSVLRNAYEHAVIAPGKRVRALLLLSASADLGSKNMAQSVDAACAIELVHAASLILDDLPCMDDAQLRRGRPALHIAFGESVAILTAVALVNTAHGLCADAGGPGATAILARSIGYDGLVEGQHRDLFPAVATPVAIEETYAKKTGALFVASCKISCAMEGASSSEARALARFAALAGTAFQLADDTLDAVATTGEAGKDVGQDRDSATLRSATSVAHAAMRKQEFLTKSMLCLDGLARSFALRTWLAAVFA